MSVMDVVAGMLTAAGVADVYTAAPARRVCAQPVVVEPAEWELIAEGKHAGRWIARVRVLVASETAAAGYDRTRACEDVLNAGDWSGFGGVDVEVLGVGCGMPSFVGTDTGGYFIWAVDARLTCEVNGAK